jgi:hypothetical protein
MTAYRQLRVERRGVVALCLLIADEAVARMSAMNAGERDIRA